MKLRLFNVYCGEGTSLAMLTEHDQFAWIGGISPNVENALSAINNILHELKYMTEEADPHHRMFVDGGHILNEESIHIIGDFNDVNELTQWIQMQYLMDDASHETFKTITKESV
ncbi:hypothetical protein HYP58_gp96 [Vibrio phage 1.097.O._10N.286.49.B3]|uniref:Uncharacterized protein n=1 Tax=Vibrio phage 1.097.O._10N.286.49.B3 TaxID=1881383 RepID=A0A2I7R0R8_9CAUD|nr:hypothetical protein HYP58_gp96 [Vibrio phage 1.097.O._10N.286.49.B3]AUR87242.1 hypothetical protein NVP1097O_96 [Vibrio phage 1.097.O._10N.286.49.B3]